MSVAQAGYLEPVGALEQAVTAAFSEVLAREGIGRDDNFFDLGGHSLLAIRLVAHLEAQCGRALALRSVFQAPTVAGLASVLGSVGSGSAYQPLIPLSKAASKATGRVETPSIVCFPPVFGNIACYAHPRVLGPLSRFGDVLAVQSPGHEPGEVPFEGYAEMVEAYTDAIAALSSRGPLVFVGWSMGGYLAHDVAARLGDQGRPVCGVVILDSVAEQPVEAHVLQPETASDIPDRPDDFVEWILKTRFGDNTQEMLSAPPDEQRRRLFAALRSDGIIAREGDLPPRETQDRFIAVLHKNLQAVNERSPSTRFNGSTFVIRARETAEWSTDAALGWGGNDGIVDTLDVPFGHFQLLNDDAAPVVLGAVSQWMENRLGIRPDK